MGKGQHRRESSVNLVRGEVDGGHGGCGEVSQEGDQRPGDVVARKGDLRDVRAGTEDSVPRADQRGRDGGPPALVGPVLPPSSLEKSLEHLNVRRGVAGAQLGRGEGEYKNSCRPERWEDWRRWGPVRHGLGFFL